MEDLNNSNLKSKLNFCVTFDDVSNSIENAISGWLSKNNIPFYNCSLSDNYRKNFGWRDKVYFIEKFLEKSDINNQLFLKVFNKKFRKRFL